MKRFVAQKNIERYRELLASETDWPARCVLEQLLAEEQAKLMPLTDQAVLKPRDCTAAEG